MHTYIHTYIHTLHTYRHTIHAYITYIHTSHTYTHKHTNTNAQTQTHKHKHSRWGSFTNVHLHGKCDLRTGVENNNAAADNDEQEQHKRGEGNGGRAPPLVDVFHVVVKLCGVVRLGNALDGEQPLGSSAKLRAKVVRLRLNRLLSGMAGEGSGTNKQTNRQHRERGGTGRETERGGKEGGNK